MLADYFKLETALMEERVHRLYRYARRLGRTQGRTPAATARDARARSAAGAHRLKPVVTGKVEHEEFTVEKLHFQSRPRLYVTGNLYVPKKIDETAAGDSVCLRPRQVKKDGVSYGNKTHYQHHGAWFARNGYVCLIIDTLQLGEIEGIHHGTYATACGGG